MNLVGLDEGQIMMFAALRSHHITEAMQNEHKVVGARVSDEKYGELKRKLYDTLIEYYKDVANTYAKPIVKFQDMLEDPDKEEKYRDNIRQQLQEIHEGVLAAEIEKGMKIVEEWQKGLSFIV